jgi:ribulose-bisphosphate carboxylase large chain
MMTDGQPAALAADRVRAVMNAVNEVADATGRKVMFAFNITDQLDRMLEHHDEVVAAGGNCVMISLNSVGLAGVEFLRRACQAPSMATATAGACSALPLLGMDFAAYQKLWRLAGVDQLHVNGFKNKFSEPDESVVRSIEACQRPLFGNDAIIPVVSSGQWGGQAPDTYRATRTLDLMYLAGGGILAHPGGPTAGVAAIRQAWEAAAHDVDLNVYANDHIELRQSLEFYGKLEQNKSGK